MSNEDKFNEFLDTETAKEIIYEHLGEYRFDGSVEVKVFREMLDTNREHVTNHIDHNWLSDEEIEHMLDEDEDEGILERFLTRDPEGFFEALIHANDVAWAEEQIEKYKRNYEVGYVK